MKFSPRLSAVSLSVLVAALALELRQGGKQVEHQLASRASGINRLFERLERPAAKSSCAVTSVAAHLGKMLSIRAGSVQTLARANRRAHMAAVSHLVIDECHRAASTSYQAVIDGARSLNPNIKLLGLSATPSRGDGRSLRKTFSNVGYQVRIGALIAQGLLVPATSRPPEQWSAADKLAAVIQSTGLNGPELGSFCRERGLYPKQVARWRQAAEDANGSNAPSMADQRELQRKNQEQAREIRRLQRELDKKEKALTEAATLLMLSKKFNQIFRPDEEH